MDRPRATLLFGLTLLLSGAPAGAQAPAAEKPERAAPAAEKLKNTLRWQTTDVDSRGYDVYRAENESGPFVKLTAAEQDQVLEEAVKNEPPPGAGGRRARLLNAASAAPKEPGLDLGRQFSNLKGWIAGAYYSSEKGLKELGWTGMKMFGSFPGCTHGGHS